MTFAITFSPNFSAYLNILSFVSLGVVAFYAIRSKVKNENQKDLLTRVGILEKEREETARLHDREREENAKQHLENQKAIANLEGQLATYKEIPLKSIAESLAKLTLSNDAILNNLTGSSLLAAATQANGGMLVKTKEENPLDVKPVDKGKE